MWKNIGKLIHLLPSLSKCNALVGSKCPIQETALRTLPIIWNNNSSLCKLLENCNCYRCAPSSKRKQRRDYRARQKGPFYEIRNDWLEVFGWGGALFLTWYVSFPCCRRRISPNPAERYAARCVASVSSPKYDALVQSLTQLLLDPTSKSVLPQVNAAKTDYESSNEDKVLQECCGKLEEAHGKVMGSLNNWLGTECMNKGRHSDAIHYFSEGANADNVSAIFNLGICYEMGLGTKQSFPTAAQMYKRASDLGHATAMYNLGVFHVHGWGGVEASIDEARNLFTAAARLGQTDARKALNWDNNVPTDHSPPTPPPSSDEDNCSPPFHHIPEPKSNDLTSTWWKVLNLKLNDFKVDPVSSSDEGIESADSGLHISWETASIH